MNVLQIAEGLWRWTAPHPSWVEGKTWGRDVGCVFVERDGDAIVLIEPLAPPAGTADADRFWAALDRDVQRSGLPVVTLVGNAFHARSAREVYRRFAGRTGAEIRVPAGVADRLDLEPTHRIADGDRLPGAITAHLVEGLDGDELAFHLTEHGTLVFADAVMGSSGGRLRVAPESWTDETDEGRRRYREHFRHSLGALLELEFDRVLPSHGEPVLADGKRALAEALDSPAWTEE